MKHLIAAFILASASLMGQTTEIVTVGPSAHADSRLRDSAVAVHTSTA